MVSDALLITQRLPYAFVPNSLLDSNLDRKAILVYLALSRFANRPDTVTVPKLASLGGLSARSAATGLGLLVATGWVLKKVVPGRASKYLLQEDPTPARVAEASARVAEVPPLTPARVAEVGAPVSSLSSKALEATATEASSEETGETKNLTALSGRADPLPVKAVLKDPAQQRRAALELLGFLNRRTGHHYKPVPATLKLIVARLREGATITQVRSVIGSKTDQWRDDPKMAEYLRPATLFNATNFANYSGQLPEGALQVEP